MSYVHPEILVNTELVSKNLPNNKLRLIEVDNDPENGYRKGHINGTTRIWCRKDISNPVTRDRIDKKQFEVLMSRNRNMIGSQIEK